MKYALLLLFYPAFKTWKPCLCLLRLAVANPSFLKKWGDANYQVNVLRPIVSGAKGLSVFYLPRSKAW